MPVTAEAPLLDQGMLDQLRQVPGLFASATERFAVNADSTLAEVRDRVADADWSGAGRLAHRLKGSASMVGAARLASRLQELEDACATEPDDAASRLGRAQDALADTQRALSALDPG